MTKPSNWTNEEIEILKNQGNKCSRFQLSNLIKRHSPIAISTKCRRLGIYKSEEFKSAHARKARGNVKKVHTVLNWDRLFSDLSFETKQILIGSILGDGFVTRNSNKSKEYCFRVAHGYKQREYLHWKFDMLQEFKPKLSNLELFTPTHPIFTQLKKSFYVDNSSRKNNLINPIVKDIDWLGFLIWYLDDGGLQSRNRDFMITSKLFKPAHLLPLIEHINNKLGLHLDIHSYNHKKGIMSRIRVPAEDRDKVYTQFKGLFEIYNIPSCMDYKLDIQPVRLETHNKWSEEELNILRNYPSKRRYSKEDILNIKNSLHLRTFDAIRARLIEVQKNGSK
jgi:hypothetical protein